MADVEAQVDQVTTLLRTLIREQGFSQAQMQEALGWGRSYVSQLLTKQKKLRVEQVLLILDVIGIEPAAFWATLYPPPPRPAVSDAVAASLKADMAALRGLVHGLTHLLLSKRLIGDAELSAAVRDVRPA